MDPIKGTGQIVIQHDFSGNLDKYSHLTNQEVTDSKKLDVLLTYIAPSTNDELQALILKSVSCQQTVQFQSQRCMMESSWVSINRDEWQFLQFPQTEQ